MTTATQTTFPQPDEVDGSWDWDKIHAPRPLTPLAGDAVVMSMAEGFTIAQHDFGSTLALQCRMFDNYLYAAFTPDADLHAADARTSTSTAASSTASPPASASAGSTNGSRR